MSAHQWKQLLSAYVDGACSPEEIVLAEQLLSERAECREYLTQLRKISSHLGHIKNETLSPDASNAVLLKAKKESSMNKNHFKNAALVVSTVVVIGLVFGNYRQNTQQHLQGRLKSAAVDVGDQNGKATPVSMTTTEQAKVEKSYYYTNSDSVASSKAMVKEMYALADAESILLANSSPSIDLSRNSSGMGQVVFGTYERARVRGFTYNGSDVRDSLSVNYPNNTEEYSTIEDNNFLMAKDTPLSTFSIDVDTASYSNVRRYLQRNQMPSQDAVRVEEMINYFNYNYPQPTGKDPFSVTTNMAICPWNKTHQLLHVGLKGKSLDGLDAPASQLTFLIDVSGSMKEPNKLLLLKDSLTLMVNQLRPQDKVAIVVYAGNAGVVLESTSNKEAILAAINNLQAGGSTAGGEGINLAYSIAQQNFINDGNNRIVLATDGDFNVGVSSTSELVRMIEEHRKQGIFLTVLGFGQGNYKDNRMQELADKGNGNYYYIDNLKEGRKVLVSELGSTLFTIAKDVKIQIEFNPAMIKSYRLIGYESRLLAKEDFNNDKKDAGEIGAGHTVTALYEIVPVGVDDPTVSTVDALKYQQHTVSNNTQELLTLKLRYKEPNQETSHLITQTLNKSDVKEEPSGDFAWASAVAEFGMLLRHSEFKGNASYQHVLAVTKANVGEDKFGLKQEFIELVNIAEQIDSNKTNQIQFK